MGSVAEDYLDCSSIVDVLGMRVLGVVRVVLDRGINDAGEARP